MDKKKIKNFLKFYFDYNLLTEEEAREALIEEGVDINRIDSKAQVYIKKLEAIELILKGKLRKEQFEKDLKEFEQSEKNSVLEEKYNYSLAARKAKEDIDKNSDEELFKYIKKKEGDNKNE